MIISIILVVFSFLFQGLISNFQNFNIISPSFFHSVYPLITLVVLYRYFKDESKYLILAFATGFLYDVVYTNTFLLNAFTFLGSAFLIKVLDEIFSDTVINANIIALIVISTYHLSLFVILSVANYADYSLMLLGSIILHSLIMTLIYTTINYLFVTNLFIKLDIRHIR